MTCYIYIIGTVDGALKVGRSIDPKRRKSQLAVLSPNRLEVLYQRPVLFGEASRIEGRAHFLLKAFHRNGEWFNVPLQTAKDAVNQAAESRGKNVEVWHNVGRKKQFPARIVLPLSDDMLIMVDASLNEGENRLDMIREAIEREVKKRRRKKLEREEAAKRED